MNSKTNWGKKQTPLPHATYTYKICHIRIYIYRYIEREREETQETTPLSFKHDCVKWDPFHSPILSCPLMTWAPLPRLVREFTRCVRTRIWSQPSNLQRPISWPATTNHINLWPRVGCKPIPFHVGSVPYVSWVWIRCAGWERGGGNLVIRVNGSFVFRVLRWRWQTGTGGALYIYSAVLTVSLFPHLVSAFHCVQIRPFVS